ncbi:hypothetical protein, partial [Rhodococcus opacus]|uniref:hypothetical protein n=1 Tax=Rhodococcus opacus TaxID=37919 RepID=UPI002949B7DF
ESDPSLARTPPEWPRRSTKPVKELVCPSTTSWSPSVAVPSECRWTAVNRSIGAGSGRPGVG